MLNIQKYFKKIINDSASWNKLKNIVTPQLLISFQCLLWSADYFLSYVHPKGNHPWLSKNFGVCLGKRPYAWEQNRAIFGEPSIPKMLKVESLQPPGHDIGHKTNDPQIFHLQKKLWVYNYYSWGLAHALGLRTLSHRADRIYSPRRPKGKNWSKNSVSFNICYYQRHKHYNINNTV